MFSISCNARVSDSSSSIQYFSYIRGLSDVPMDSCDAPNQSSRSSGRKRTRPRPRRDRRRRNNRFDWEEAYVGVSTEGPYHSPAPTPVKRRLFYSSDPEPSHQSSLDELPTQDLHGGCEVKISADLEVDFGGEDRNLSQMRSETEDSEDSSASLAEGLRASSYARDYSRRSRPMSANTWQKLIAILATSGTNRLTVVQYSFFRDTVNWVIEQYAPHESLLPSYSTVQRTLLPNLRANNFPRSEKHFLPVDLQKAGAKRTTHEGSIPNAEVEVILPSTWAVQDVSFMPTWDIMRSGNLSETASGFSNPVFSSASSASIVCNRKKFLDEPHHSVFSQSTDAGLAACCFSRRETVSIVLESEPIPKE